MAMQKKRAKSAPKSLHHTENHAFLAVHRGFRERAALTQVQTANLKLVLDPVDDASTWRGTIHQGAIFSLLCNVSTAAAAFT
ncbi:MAG: hypothetical protein ABI227_14200 [Rhodanobacter sp.]